MPNRPAGRADIVLRYMEAWNAHDAEANLGDRSHYYLDIEDHEKPVAVAEQNIEEDVDYATEENTKVWLSWKSSAVVLLPRD